MPEYKKSTITLAAPSFEAVSAASMWQGKSLNKVNLCS